MAKRIFLSNIDLALNQLLQAKLENLASDPANTESRFYYNTVSKRIKYFNGTAWLTVTDSTDLTSFTSHINDASKHYAINDTGTGTTDLLSANKILALISAVNGAVAGSLVFQGGYDASTDSPHLDTTPIAINNGFVYVVTVAGTFFTEPLQVGDMIIAKQNTPTTLAHWVLVNKNIPDIVASSEGSAGIIALATQAEVTTGTDDTKAVTPLKLKTNLGITATLTVAKKFTTTLGDGGSLTYAIAHNIGARTVNAQVYRTATPYDVIECEIVQTSTTVTTFNFNVAPSAGQYTVVIIG